MKIRAINTAICSLIIVLLFSQCSQKSENSTEVATDAVAMVSDEKDAATAEDVANQSNSVPTKSNVDTNIQRMLTKEGTLRWETDDVEKTHAAILEQAKKYNAYISNDNQSRNDYHITTTIEMRIPSNQFDKFMTIIEKDVTKFDEKHVEVLDVTEEFIDISARMRTKKELEQHYYELLKQTKNVSEVLQVEEQLNIVRSEIESAEGRLKYLKDKVTMSTLNLTFYETIAAPVGFFGEIGKSFVDGWKGFLYFILGIITVWPIIIVIMLIVVFVIRRRKNRI